jgi:hypothetical protein
VEEKSAKVITRGQLEDEIRRLKEELERAAANAVTNIHCPYHILSIISFHPTGKIEQRS